jgi:hypothetical protein
MGSDRGGPLVLAPGRSRRVLSRAHRGHQAARAPVGLRALTPSPQHRPCPPGAIAFTPRPSSAPPAPGVPWSPSSRGARAAILGLPPPDPRRLEAPLRHLLADFGPPRRSVHPEYPFWYLKNDGFWTVHSEAPLLYRTGKDQPTRHELIAKDASGEEDVEESWGAEEVGPRGEVGS